MCCDDAVTGTAGRTPDARTTRYHQLMRASGSLRGARRVRFVARIGLQAACQFRHGLGQRRDGIFEPVQTVAVLRTVMR